MLVLAGVMMSIVALFFAPLSRSRTGRVMMLLVVIMLLLGAEWLLGLAAYELKSLVTGAGLDVDFFFVLLWGGGIVLIAPAVGYLLLTLTAAQLTPAIENRSTKIRIALLIVNAAVAAWVSLGSMGRGGVYVGMEMLVIGWDQLDAYCGALASSMLVAESAVLTPRVQRDLPQSFLARATFAWLAPGPATGLVFSTLNLALLAGLRSLFTCCQSGFWPICQSREQKLFIQFVLAFQFLT